MNDTGQAGTEAQALGADAQTLRDAAVVFARYFGGLGTTIAVLEEKSRTLELWACEADADT